MEHWKEIGAVTATNPARREIRVKLHRGRGHTVEATEWIRLVLTGGESMRCKVLTAEAHGDEAILTLVPGVTRDNVARMKKAIVEAPLPEDDPPSPDWRDFVGLQVQTHDGRALGEVTAIFQTAAHGIIEIAKPGGGAILLPAIDEIDMRPDWNARILTVGDLEPYAVDDAEDGDTRLV